MYSSYINFNRARANIRCSKFIEKKTNSDGHLDEVDSEHVQLTNSPQLHDCSSFNGPPWVQIKLTPAHCKYSPQRPKSLRLSLSTPSGQSLNQLAWSQLRHSKRNAARKRTSAPLSLSKGANKIIKGRAQQENAGISFKKGTENKEDKPQAEEGDKVAWIEIACNLDWKGA